MKVNKKNMQTIWFDKNSGYVKIINQTMLPFKLEIKELKNLEDTLIAIKDTIKILEISSEGNKQRKE